MTTTPTTPGALAEKLLLRANDIRATLDHIEWHGAPIASKDDEDLMCAAAKLLAALPAERPVSFDEAHAALDIWANLPDGTGAVEAMHEVLKSFVSNRDAGSPPAERAQDWERGGTLGNDERYIRRSSPESEASVQKALGLPVDTGHEGGEVCDECGRCFGKHFPKCSKAERAQAAEPVAYRLWDTHYNCARTDWILGKPNQKHLDTEERTRTAPHRWVIQYATYPALASEKAAEPYAWFWFDGSESGVVNVRQDYEAMKVAHSAMKFTPVYTHPAPVTAAIADSGRIWSFLRNVIEQGRAIQQDSTAGKFESYELLSARIDEAARERADEFEKKFAAPPPASADKVTEDMIDRAMQGWANADTDDYLDMRTLWRAALLAAIAAQRSKP